MDKRAKDKVIASVDQLLKEAGASGGVFVRPRTSDEEGEKQASESTPTNGQKLAGRSLAQALKARSAKLSEELASGEDPQTGDETPAPSGDEQTEPNNPLDPEKKPEGDTPGDGAPEQPVDSPENPNPESDQRGSTGAPQSGGPAKVDEGTTLEGGQTGEEDKDMSTRLRDAVGKTASGAALEEEIEDFTLSQISEIVLSDATQKIAAAAERIQLSEEDFDLEDQAASEGSEKAATRRRSTQDGGSQDEDYVVPGLSRRALKLAQDGFQMLDEEEKEAEAKQKQSQEKEKVATDKAASKAQDGGGDFEMPHLNLSRSARALVRQELGAIDDE